MNDRDNNNIEAILDAMKEHNVSFKEAVEAIASAGDDKKFMKDLDEHHNAGIFDDYWHWQDDIAV
jgi:hypothetical protein